MVNIIPRHLTPKNKELEEYIQSNLILTDTNAYGYFIPNSVITEVNKMGYSIYWLVNEIIYEKITLNISKIKNMNINIDEYEKNV